MDFENKLHLQGYMSLLEGTSHLFKDCTLDLQAFLDFPHGYAVYCFDITPDHANRANFNLIQQGNLSLELKLAKAHTKSITLVCYLEYEGLLTIDHTGAVTYE